MYPFWADPSTLEKALFASADLLVWLLLGPFASTCDSIFLDHSDSQFRATRYRNSGLNCMIPSQNPLSGTGVGNNREVAPTAVGQESSLSEQMPTVVSEHFYNVETSHLLHMIADMLYRLTVHNDKIPLTSSSLSRFHSRAAPAISIADYLRRIMKYAAVEKVCLLILLIYIDRVCESHRSFTISTLTVHRFIITSICVSSKALSDSYCSNGFYAKVGGISTKELNNLELELLFLIDWRLACEFNVLQQYYVNLVKQHPAYCRAITGAAPLSVLPQTFPASLPLNAAILPLAQATGTAARSSVRQNASPANANISSLSPASQVPCRSSAGSMDQLTVTTTHLPPIAAHANTATSSNSNALKSIKHEPIPVPLPSLQG